MESSIDYGGSTKAENALQSDVDVIDGYSGEIGSAAGKR
jgi:hypothetical protein